MNEEMISNGRTYYGGSGKIIYNIKVTMDYDVSVMTETEALEAYLETLENLVDDLKEEKKLS